MNTYQQNQIAKLNAIRPECEMTEFNELFQNMEFGNIRTLTDPKGNPWFVGRDIALALGYVNSREALHSHCKGVKKYYPLQTSGGVQNIRIISEGDMYRLVGGSHLPAAQRFESWVYDIVLPTIRKHGVYNQSLVDKETFMAGGLDSAYDTCLQLEQKANTAEESFHEAEQARVAAEVDYEMLSTKHQELTNQYF